MDKSKALKEFNYLYGDVGMYDYCENNSGTALVITDKEGYIYLQTETTNRCLGNRISVADAKTMEI